MRMNGSSTNNTSSANSGSNDGGLYFLSMIDNPFEVTTTSINSMTRTTTMATRNASLMSSMTSEDTTCDENNNKSTNDSSDVNSEINRLFDAVGISTMISSNDDTSNNTSSPYDDTTTINSNSSSIDIVPYDIVNMKQLREFRISCAVPLPRVVVDTYVCVCV